MRDLRDTEPPDADGARRRGWALTAQAFADRNARAEIRSLRKTPRRFRRVVEGLVVVLVVGVVGALTPPGAAVADWVVRAVDPAPARKPKRQPASQPVRQALDGQVLTLGSQLRLNGRPLGPWSGAAFSPHARYVVAWRGRRLVALAPDGRRAWAIRAPAPVTSAAWSPEGFHVAYLAGRSVRVVAGNGLRDRAFRGPVHDVAPVFRPGERRAVTYVRVDGRVEVVDVFSGVRRALSGPRLGRGARSVRWTRGGRRLVVRTTTGARVWDAPR